MDTGGILEAPSYPLFVRNASLGTGTRPKMTTRTSRPSVDEYFIALAKLVATRSTCRHRAQGVVLVRNKRIIATGYNGSPPGQVHCVDLEYCLKADGGYCRAEGLHGESNAIASAARMGIPTEGTTAYCVYSPCRTCCNLLKSAGIVEVKYLEVYDGFTEGPDYLNRTLYIKTNKITSVKASE